MQRGKAWSRTVTQARAGMRIRALAAQTGKGGGGRSSGGTGVLTRRQGFSVSGMLGAGKARVKLVMKTMQQFAPPWQ